MKRFVKSALAATLMLAAVQTFAATPVSATTTNMNTNANVSPAERAKIESVVHQYLISKPEVLIEAMQVLQQKQMQQADQTIKQTKQTASTYTSQLFNQANDPIAGNPSGKVTVVEFFDYQCPHCVDMAPVMSAIIKANPDVRVVYKEFPIRGPMSDFAARAALAANKQGKYVDFSHALLTSNKPLTQEIVFSIAKDQGINVDQLKKDMADASITAQLKSNMTLAQNLKLFGTPALFIGKTNGGTIEYIPGFLSQQELQKIIDKNNN